MAGHSKFANIKHKKNAKDAKRAKLFTRLTKEITVSAQTGQPDPEFNPRLRSAISTAKKAGVPKDKIEMAVKKGAGEIESERYEEIRYEGYAPCGVALIVEALTDNRNRTAADVRAAFAKNGGNLGETGSVNFMFKKVGLVEYKREVASDEAMFEAAVEAGATNVESSDDVYEITCESEDLHSVSASLEKKFGESESTKLDWTANDRIELDVEQAQKVVNLIDALEDCDDVQYVSGNYYISDEIAEQLQLN